MKQWRGVLFTDESRFTLFLPGRSTSCIPTSRKRFADTCVDETGQVWGWLYHGSGRHCARGKITIDCCRGQYKRVKYRGEILRPVEVPLMQLCQLILQQDNFRPHVATGFRQTITSSQLTGHHTVQIVPHRAFAGRSGQLGKFKFLHYYHNVSLI